MSEKQLKELAEKSSRMEEQELQKVVDELSVDDALQLFDYIMKNY